ncbi:MAG: ATP synthase subunit I, partial [Actinomycetota bacterium]|nr:ATP synthase subunit I [Actinomycetota bacterium]
ARVSLGLLYAAALGGYLLRLALITVAVLVVVNQSWVEVVPLSVALVTAHLGLFVWEARFVSTQLAFPGLKPRPKRPHVEKGAP